MCNCSDSGNFNKIKPEVVNQMLNVGTVKTEWFLWCSSTSPWSLCNCKPINWANRYQILVVINTFEQRKKLAKKVEKMAI